MTDHIIFVIILCSVRVAFRIVKQIAQKIAEICAINVKITFRKCQYQLVKKLKMLMFRHIL